MMIRIASACILVSLLLLYAVLIRTVAQTALPFAFVGIPALVLGILIYGYSIRRLEK